MAWNGATRLTHRTAVLRGQCTIDGDVNRSTHLDRVWGEAMAQLGALLGASFIPRTGARLDALVQPELPVLRYLDAAFALADASTQGACELLRELRGILRWRRNDSYSDAAFLARYGYCELVGPAGLQRSNDLAIGLLLLAPDVTYAEHRHPARETYVVLAGRALWRQGDGLWRDHAPGRRIEHAPMEPHAMRTGSEPLLAAYLWHDHLHEGARLVAPGS